MHRYLRATSRLLAMMVLARSYPTAATAQEPAPTPPPAAQAPSPDTAQRTTQLQSGRIAGRVVDQETGRPLASARVTVVDRPETYETDLDGRYRTGELPVGTYTVRAILIGYRATQQAGVRVLSDRTTVAHLAMSSAPIELQELVVEAPPVERASSEAGLLAIQQAAPTVMDGISAETMSRSPDSDASDAIIRVTGASVVGDKFVYVRGLGERYGNTLLNGSELPSPEPLKKVVPLDLFPASLLESIVTIKAGRPDRPGDVTGAAVEIETKEFPENRVLQLNVTQEYNSQTTFERVARGPRGGTDFLGIDDGRRMPEGKLPAGEQTGTPAGELFAEGIRNVWTPTDKAPLNGSLGLNLGGTITSGDSPLGGILSFNYSSKTEHVPDRLYQLVRASTPDEEPVLGYRYQQTTAVVDWGSVLNFTKRLGTGTKLSFRNLYSRNAEETFLSYLGFNTDNQVTDNSRGYQAQYVERDLFQTQLAGEHLLPWLWGSRLEWRGSLALAHRDEPENRNLLYQRLPDGVEQFIENKNNLFFYRFLNDRVLSGQVDWAIPMTLRAPADAEIKFGVLRREKTREFDARTYGFQALQATADEGFLRLPPELLFAPENLGTQLTYFATNGPPPAGSTGSEGTDPSYDATDRMTAGYAMLDVPLLSRLRLVGGVRVEWWRLYLFNGSEEVPIGAPVVRANTDALWSANLTLGVTERMNLRLAAYRSVARPEARELSPAFYVPVGGECGYYGNADLVRTAVVNADLRWELYPSPGEVISLGGFYKDFDRPIFELISFSTASACSYRYFNARSARNYGLEAEFRKRLDFLSPAMRGVTLGMNLTYVSSESADQVVLGSGLPDVLRTRQFIGQSPYLANLNLSYLSEGGTFSGTALLNYFDDRVARYGETIAGGDGVVNIPDIVERGRTTLDAKVQQRLGALALSASGRNLLNSKVRFVQELPGRELIANAYSPGVSFAFGVGYDF